MKAVEKAWEGLKGFGFLPLVVFRCVWPIFWWMMGRYPRVQKKYGGTVGLTAVDMFGKGAGWGIPIVNHTQITLGGIAEKPGVVDGQIAIREYLSMTLSFDHDLIDGAPAARFVQRLKAGRIVPEFQHLEAGESIPLSPTTGFTVAEIDPPSVLTLRATMSPLTGMPVDPHEPKPDAYFDGSWVFVLEELDEQTTRVIERVRADYQPYLWLAPLVYLFLEPATYVMERKMLLGIKQRAEKGRSKETAERPSAGLQTPAVSG